MKNRNKYKIKYELMERMLVDSFASSLAISLIVSVVTLFFWQQYTEKTYLLLWATSIFVVIFTRTYFVKQYLQNKMKLERIYIIFNSLTILSALILSGGFVGLFLTSSELYQVFLIIVIAGTSSGAVISLSYFRKLSLSYLLILILPLIYLLIAQKSSMLHLLDYLIVLFLIMAILFSIKYNKSIVDMLKTKQELEIEKNNFELIFKELPIGLITYDDKLIITQANKAFADILQAPLEKLIGLDMTTLKDKTFLEDMKKVFENKRFSYEGKYNSTLSGKTVWIKAEAIPIYNAQEESTWGLGIVENTTQQVETQKKLQYQASYDSLTGLTNRNAFAEHLQRFISKLKRNKEYGLLLFIDLDNFKNINDSLGHDVGDDVLQIFAQRVKKILRKEDIFARLGGDEFVILVSQTSTTPEKIHNVALNIADKIHVLMKEPIESDDSILYITLSLGIKILQANEDDIHTVLKHADSAMYASKNAGKNTTTFYNTSMSQQMNRQLVLHNELKTAIQENQFELYLQPIVDLKTDKIVSAEALIRWNHPAKGIVFPDAFINYAESSNLIIEIGNWVIKRAFEIYQELQNSLKDIAINISLKQFYQNDFENILLTQAKKQNIDPSCIKLELTESITLNRLENTISKMSTLKSHGFKFSMDDFGTGYSSLSYLKNLPFDYLKIDQSFVREMLNNKNDEKLVQIIIDMAQQFNFLVIAEGVETAKHVQFMKEHGCDFYQGYFTSKPVPLEAFKKLL